MSRKGLLAECDELKIDSAQCTKCGLVESDVSQLHRHILDCGGDTEWLKTMVHQTTKSPNSKKSRYVGITLFNLIFDILIVKYDHKEKIGDPLILEDVKMAELDMDLNDLHQRHLYQLLKRNRVMVST